MHLVYLQQFFITNLSSISLEARVIHVVPRKESWMTRPQEKWKSVDMEKIYI